MEIRLTPLQDQSQHFLDSAADEGSLLSHTTLALGLYGDPDEIERTIAWREPGHRGWGSHTARNDTCLRLVALGDEIIARLPAERREAIMIMGARSGSRAAVMLAQFCADWCHTDATRGGAGTPFRRILRENRDCTPTKGLARQLRAPGFIRRYVRHDAETGHGVNLGRRFIALPLIVSPQSMRYVQDLHWDLDRQLKAFRAHWKGDTTPTNRRILMEIEGARGRPATLPYRIVRKNRKIVKRAAVMAAAMLGASTVGAFARGEPVILPGQELALRVKLIGQLHHHGHGRLAVDVLDAAGQDLASLCVYVDDTPALDQLTAFALHMQSGLEREVLATANVITTTTVGVDHPVMLKRNAERAKAIRHVNIGPGHLFATDHEMHQRVKDLYWSETQGVWVRAVMERMFGRNWREVAECLQDEAFAQGYDLPEVGAEE